MQSVLHKCVLQMDQMLYKRYQATFNNALASMMRIIDSLIRAANMRSKERRCADIPLGRWDVLCQVRFSMVNSEQRVDDGGSRFAQSERSAHHRKPQLYHY